MVSTIFYEGVRVSQGLIVLFIIPGCKELSSQCLSIGRPTWTKHRSLCTTWYCRWRYWAARGPWKFHMVRKLNAWGTGQATKTDEFSEKIQKGFDPPPHLGKKTLSHFFPNKPCLKPCAIVQNLRYKFLDWKWPPPFGTFPNIHPLWWRHPSLMVVDWRWWW